MNNWNLLNAGPLFCLILSSRVNPTPGLNSSSTIIQSNDSIRCLRLNRDDVRNQCNLISSCFSIKQHRVGPTYLTDLCALDCPFGVSMRLCRFHKLQDGNRPQRVASFAPLMKFSVQCQYRGACTDASSRASRCTEWRGTLDESTSTAVRVVPVFAV